jgi:hypothetical protein
VAYLLAQGSGLEPASWTREALAHAYAANPYNQPTAYAQPVQQWSPPPMAAREPKVELADAPAHPRAARAHPLGETIEPRAIFTCPPAWGELESGGPGGRVQLRRSERGLCVASRQRPLTKWPPSRGAPVLVLRFHEPATDPEADFEVRLTAPSGAPFYQLSTGWRHGSYERVYSGAVGVAKGRLALLVDDPGLPSWVRDSRASSWSARLR